MTNKKRWEFIPGDEITIAPGRTVKRIRALVAIDGFGVSRGDLGGYVESETNLAQVYGNARVYGDAQVYGDAWVSGNAQVYGNAWVSGNAWVYGNAQVYGNAWVSGNAWVYGDGLIFWASKVGYKNGTLTVYNTKDNTLQVTRGCFVGSVDEFLEASERKHDDDTHLEYRLLIEIAHSRITRARANLEADQ